jgi:hypothetical protein
VGAAEALGGLLQDRLGDAVRIVIHLAVPDADDRPAFPFEVFRAIRIVLIVDVLAAVDFDDQPRLPAGKIGDIRRDRELACEFGTEAGKQRPQCPFLRGCFPAQSPGLLGCALWDAPFHGMGLAEPRFARTHP